MACLELHCSCGYVDHTNNYTCTCPQCGNQLGVIFDEPKEREPPDFDYDESE